MVNGQYFNKSIGQDGDTSIINIFFKKYFQIIKFSNRQISHLNRHYLHLNCN